ncbi:MAG: hypothetical protein IJ697_05620 [Synergistaceae bacterium]|nr:hypothetical protein [Synergistaceae bacterium]
MDNDINNETSSVNSENSSSIEMCLEIAKLEYEYSFRRAEKFDNKVYILLTVCGFMFVMFMNAVSNIGEIDIFSPLKSNWILAYDILIVLCVTGMITILVRLVYALSGLKLKRHDSNLIIKRNMLSSSPKAIARFTIMRYEIARDYNIRQIDRRYTSLEKSVKILVALAVLLIAISIVSNFAVKI